MAGHKDDQWRYRRRFMFATIAFCMATIAYVLVNNLDTEPAEIAVNMSFVIIGTTVSSYVFGAVWQDKKKKEDSNGDSSTLPSS